MPPTGSTRPRSDSSPVRHVSPRAARPVNRLSRATARVTPADGPSCKSKAHVGTHQLVAR